MNNKGFTLVEILSVIVLIGLLMGIGIPGISRISQNMKQKSLNTKIKLVEEAGVFWGQDNKSVLQTDSSCTTTDGNTPCKKISIKELIEEDYLDSETYEDIVYNNPVDGNTMLNNCVYIYKKNNRVKANYSKDDASCKDNNDGGNGFVTSIPTLAASDTWYTSSTPRTKFTTINIVDSADADTIANATESWPAAADQDGDGTNNKDIMCYVNGETLTIAGNGAGKIMANADSSDMFSKFSSILANINGLDILDTSNVKTMAGMFQIYNSSLTSLDVSNWDTSNVTDMSYMFCYCRALTSLDVSKWNTSNVTTMRHMFMNCSNLNTIILGENFGQSNIISEGFVFYCETTVNTTIYGANDTMKAYDWARDKRNVTFINN